MREESKSHREKSKEPILSMDDDDQIANPDENINMNMPKRAKTGVGANSNMRRKTSDGGYIQKKTPNKRIGNEIIL